MSTPHPKTLIEKLRGPKFLIGLAGMGAAAAYVVYRHIDWKHKPDSRKRMIISHAIFWPLCAVGLKIMHLNLGHQENWKKFLGSLAGAGVIIGGFEGGFQLAKKLVPKIPPSPAMPPAQPSAIVLQQTYRQGFQDGLRMQRPISAIGFPTQNSPLMVGRTAISSPYARIY